MPILFETLKWLFFFMSIIVGIFFLRWDYVLEEGVFKLSWNILMPWYILLTWMMLGYIISSIIIVKNDIQDEEEKNKAYVKWLVLWTVLGIWLSSVYILTIV